MVELGGAAHPRSHVFSVSAYRERSLASSSRAQRQRATQAVRVLSFPMYFPYIKHTHTYTLALSHPFFSATLSTRCQVSSFAAPSPTPRSAPRQSCHSARPLPCHRPLSVRSRRRFIRFDIGGCSGRRTVLAFAQLWSSAAARRPQCRAAGAPSSQALSSDAGKDAGCGCFIIAQQHYETGILSSE